MDVNLIRSAVTLVSLALFIGLMAWTWWPRQQAGMQSAAMLPFEGESDIPGSIPSESTTAMHGAGPAAQGAA